MHGVAARLSGTFAVALLLASPAAPTATSIFRIDHVADGDTVDLTNGARVRLVQIDTPEVYFSPECYGAQASTITKRLLPPEQAARRGARDDSIDGYGRLLRYVFRARDNLHVNVYLVRVGAAAPYFYDHRLGRYAALLTRLAAPHRRTRPVRRRARCRPARLRSAPRR